MPIVAGIAAFVAALLISYVVFPLAGSGATDFMVHRLVFTVVVTAIVASVANGVEKRREQERLDREAEKVRENWNREELRRRAEKESRQAKRQASLAREQHARVTAFKEAERRVAHLREIQQRADHDHRGPGHDPATHRFGVITDEALASIVWDKLKTPRGERTTITVDQMSGLDGALSIDGLSSGVRDLEGLQYATGLTALELSFLDDVQTLRPLAALQHLKRLRIWDAAVKDLDALATLEELQDLELAKLNHVTDFRPLAGLRNLTNFHVSDMPDSLEFDSASGLTGLTELVVSNMDFHDLRKLSGLAQLSELTLWDLGSIDSLKPLGQLPRLGKLTLEGAWLEKPGKLADLTSLTSLSMRKVSGVKSMNQIARLSRLRELELDEVFYEHHSQGTMDLSPLAELRSLTTLRLVERKYEGYFGGLGAITGLRGLTTLDLSANIDDADVRTISHFTGLESLSLASAVMGNLTPLTALSRLESLSLKGEFIEFGPTKLYGLEELASLPRLVSLTLDTVEDYQLIGMVSMFAGLKELTLKGLWLDSDGEDLWPLTNLTKLESLELQDNYRLVPDLTPLAELPRLTSLTLRGNTNWNTRPLADMANLSINGRKPGA